MLLTIFVGTLSVNGVKATKYHSLDRWLICLNRMNTIGGTCYMISMTGERNLLVTSFHPTAFVKFEHLLLCFIVLCMIRLFHN